MKIDPDMTAVFRDQIISFAKRIEDLHRRSAGQAVSADEVVKEAFQELEVSLHELEISHDELRRQNEASCLISPPMRMS